MPACPTRRFARLALLLSLLGPKARGQALTPAESYDTVFAQLQRMGPQVDHAATLRNVILRRDAIVLHLDDGRLFPTSPVAGRMVGAVFVGHGSVSFAPPLGIERAELKRVLGDTMLDTPITAAVLVFTDTTAVELARQTAPAPGAGATEATGAIHNALRMLLDEDARSVEQTTLAEDLLNGAASGFFYAHLTRAHGKDLMLMVDPEQVEAVSLLRAGGSTGPKLQVVTQFRRAERMSDTTDVVNGALDPLRLESYRIESTIAKGLGFSAVATVRLTARQETVRWAPFWLYDELLVDSVRDGSGAADTIFRAKHSPALWVRFDPPVRAGESREIRVAYHGDLIGFGSLMEQFLPPRATRLGLPPMMDNWLFVKASQTWFPRYGNDQAAPFDLVFHAPKRYQMASIGRLVSTQVDGDVSTTHWVMDQPTDQACFNLGEFVEVKVTDPRIPPVTVQMNSEAHRRLEDFFKGQANPQADVTSDVANSLAFFSRVFGAPLYNQYYATEIPFSYGQAFPGLMYLSLWTFQTLDESGGQETFRAHEMAHQWWGVGVAPAGSRDAWLSEGFADFSGLWYMQAVLHDNEKFFKKLEASRKRIRSRGTGAPPIGIGWRIRQTDHPDDYSTVIYDKGAWVLQMLRNMMLNLRTMNEDAFTATMKDFYTQYRGRRASTADFQRVVERHAGVSMTWFFDEWLNGTAIPTYTLSWKPERAPDGSYTLHVRVRQDGVGPAFMMPVPLRIAFGDSAHAYVRLTIRGPLTEQTLQLPMEPTALELNPLQSVLAEVKTEPWAGDSAPRP